MGASPYLAALFSLLALCRLPATLNLQLLQQLPLVRADVFRDRHLDRNVVVAANLSKPSEKASRVTVIVTGERADHEGGNVGRTSRGVQQSCYWRPRNSNGQYAIQAKNGSNEKHTKRTPGPLLCCGAPRSPAWSCRV